MNHSNSVLINRFFTRNTFQQLINEGKSSTYSAAVKQYVPDQTNKKNSDYIHEIYQYLKKNYQNEYFYKNTLFNKLLLGRHSLQTTTALTEIPVENSKADFILINGKAVVYEIKTELDNFERLNTQIEDYYKAFSHVVVVTGEKSYKEIEKRLQGTPVGIYVLTQKDTLSRRKEPQEQKKYLLKRAMFKILRKKEYEWSLTKYFDALPNVSQFEYYGACQKLFDSLPVDVAYKSFIRMLKERGKVESEEYKQIPYALKFIVYFSQYKKKDYDYLLSFLKQ